MTYDRGMAAITFDIGYTQERSKKTTGLRLFYALPHLIITEVLDSLAQVLAVIQWFIVVFTGKRHLALFNLSRGVLDWQARATSYFGLMYDVYPNFGFEKLNEPVQFAAEYEETANRLTTGLRIIWAIPALVITIGLAIAGVVVTIVSWFTILFTGKHPRGQFDFLLKAHRYGVRTQAYMLLLTDTYPKYQ